ncbi:WxL domain-containing protein [Enterococcus hulanensis]|uniref:WxL domain-containing protein n=1 Tax=Enterococcus hulanensis TaxID=2559929 RepID=UPI00288F9BBD|nr:WxL domain-containing protein [Enterococcus hulanensis]MDT2661806.1 WxL domain-containing protein [Enterococcus hulanensis]
MNKRLVKVVSFALLTLLILGESSQLVLAVTEEAVSSTAATEEVASSESTVDSAKAVNESSSVESTTQSSVAATTDTTTEKKSKKEKADTDKIKPQAANDPVTIPDPALYKWIRETLNGPTYNQNIPDGTPITEAQMEMLTSLTRGSVVADYTPISNLTGIEYAVNLKELNFVGLNSISGRFDDQFTALPANFKNLTKLKKLVFYRGELSDINALKDHPVLEEFSAVENRLTSLEGLTGCKELQKITLNGSDNDSYRQQGEIKNFKGLESATKLKEVHFRKYDEQKTATTVGNSEPSYVGLGLQSLEGLNCASTLEILDLKGHPGLHTLAGLENYTSLTELTVTGASNYNGRQLNYTNPGGIKDLDFDPAIHTETYLARGLRGPNAIDALSNCTALKKVQLDNQAIEDLSSLAGKTLIEELDLSCNLITTLQPLLTTDKIVKLDVSNNLLTNLSGINNTNTLKELDCSMQNAGAQYMSVPSTGDWYLRGLLDDITAINPTSLGKLSCYSNRLESLDSLKGAAVLNELQAYDNRLSDIKGDLAGCVSLDTVNLGNNSFVNFKDIGLEASEGSLKKLYIERQGIYRKVLTSFSNTDTILEDLEGLEKFTVMEYLNLDCNQIKDSEMVHIPKCIKTLTAFSNELQDKAFQSFNPTDFTRLEAIRAPYNHISDITPLEQFSGIEVYVASQTINVPKHGGTLTKKAAPDVGFEVDVLKSDNGTGLIYNNFSGWGSTTPTVKPGTSILTVDDPNYDLSDRTPNAKFAYAGNTSGFTSFDFNGEIYFKADYENATTAEVKLVPTDINGTEISEIPQGGLIYWRATVNSENTHYLVKPDIRHHLQYTEHDILDPYVEPTDSLASEYVQGARVEINGTYVPTPTGIWEQLDALHNMINKTNVAEITIVTKVRDNATPGTTANLYFNVRGKNFKLAGDTKTVKIKASAPEELNLTVPKRFDFGKKNEASKLEKTYGLDTKTHSNDEQTDGFKIRVTDSMRNANRVDWEVVGKLSDLTASNGAALKNASVSPKLSLKDIALFEITGVGGTETATAITHGTAGKPTWNQNIDLTAGGPSVTLSEADKADGEGVWDYQIPFDKVKLEVPSNVNNQAGYTFNGKITWTLDDTL